jgi:hypothetical protein
MDQIAKMDMTTFPGEDPKVMAQRAKQAEKLRKEAAAEDKEAKRVSRAKKAPAKKTSAKSSTPAMGDDVRERVIILRKLTQYYAKLGKKISVAKPRSYPQDLKKLRELLLAVETDLAANGGIEQAAGLYVSSVVAAEKLAPLVPFLNLKLSGPAASLSQTVIQNKEMWEDLVTETAIAHCEWFMVGPVKRLVMVTAQMAMQVHNANSAMSKSMEGSQVPSDKLKKEAEDL